MNMKERETLEALVDAHSVCAVVEALAEICVAKADHLEGAWQEAVAAKLWEGDAKKLLACVRKLER